MTLKQKGLLDSAAGTLKPLSENLLNYRFSNSVYIKKM